TKIDHSLLHKIHQPAGRGDEYIDTALEGCSLLAVTGPADYGCAGDAFRGELAAFGIDLVSQFTRRGKHEHRGAPAILSTVQLLQDRQQKCCGFTCASLGGSDDIAAIEYDRNGHCLYGSGFSKTHLLALFRQERLQA